MIGKIFRRFSNDWKKFSGSHKGHKEHKGIRGAGGTRGGERTTTQGRHKVRQTIMTIADNGELQEKNENRVADRNVRLRGGREG